MKNISLAILCAITVQIGACTTIQFQTIDWSVRQQKLSQISSWKMRGHFTTRTPSSSSSVSFHWQQDHQNYVLNLFGPLGFGAVKIQGQPGEVTLLSTKTGLQKASTPEALAQRELGFLLPVSNLQYWVRGLPVPHQKASMRWDEYHHLVQLKQNGWEISYANFIITGSNDLPTLLVLRNGTLELNIEIAEWETA